MKYVVFAKTISLTLCCILANTPAAAASRYAKRADDFISKKAGSPSLVVTHSVEKNRRVQGNFSTLNSPAVFDPRLSPFDAIDWFDVLKKTLGARVSGGIHGKITKNALKELKIKNGFIEKVVKANWRTDWDEYKKVLPPVPNENYDPAHHFDRTYGVTHSDSFKRGAKYIQEQRSIILAGLKGEGGRNLNDAAQAMGRALHALQDFFSHSNVIDLSPEDWDAAMKALDAAAEPPPSLKITGYDGRRGSSLVGDEYGHDDFSKENPNKNDESKSRMKAGAQAFDPDKTKFQRAKEAATERSKDWLVSIREEIGRHVWKQIEKS